jgi:CTP:molybdopterin cytidylyltransferase MocA
MTDTPKHPITLPDDVAREIGALAQKHGYFIERITLCWMTNDLGNPVMARVEYKSDLIALDDDEQEKPKWAGSGKG